MSTAEKRFTTLGGDLPSILVKNFLILEQLGLVCLVGLYFVGVLFCTLVWVFSPPCSINLAGHVHLFWQVKVSSCKSLWAFNFCKNVI